MSYINFNRHTFAGTGSDNTPEGAFIRGLGKHITITKTLSANNTSTNVNLFLLTGTEQIFQLHGEITAITTLNNITNCYFDLWDGTVSVPLTKTTTAAMSGFVVGSFFIKDSDVTTALSTINANQGRVQEAAAGAKEGAPFITTSKLATNTYIRFNYTTTDTPINATFEFHLVYADIDNVVITAV